MLTSLRTVGGETDTFPTTISLHQGFALSPYLFVLDIDNIYKHIQDENPSGMLFADNIVLIDETTKVNYKLEL